MKLFSLFFLFTATLFAATEPSTFKTNQSVDGKDLLLNGVGLRTATLFNVKVYSAGLYLAQKATTVETVLAAKGPKQIDLEFLRDVDADKIRDAFDTSFPQNCEKACESGKGALADLKKLVVDVKKGDHLVYTFRESSVEMAHNGKKLGLVTAAGFPSDLLATWIGKKPPTEDLKRGLLGLN